MKTLQFALFFSIIIACFSNCKEAKVTESELTEDKQYALDTFTFKGKQLLIESDTLQSYVMVVNPKYINGFNDALKIRRIKELQFLALNDYVGDDSQIASKTLEEAASKFVSISNEEEEKPFNFMYVWESIVDTICINETVNALSINTYMFTGGAHPNSFITFLNFDAQTGEEIDLIADISDTVAFKNLIYEAFVDNEMAEFHTENFDKSAYFIDDGFFLPENMAITAAGLLCMYNPYEIASYSRGPIIFTVLWEDLEGKFQQRKYYPFL